MFERRVTLAGNADKLARLMPTAHPQVHDLQTALARVVADPESWLEVHCPDRKLSVRVSHLSVLARPRRSLAAVIRTIPRLVAPAPSDPTALARAERLGFTRSARQALNPKTGAAIPIPQIEAQFVNAEDGADWCLAALQDVHGIGDAWLWMTDLDFDDWPDPLPRPQVWPPAAG